MRVSEQLGQQSVRFLGLRGRESINIYSGTREEPPVWPESNEETIFVPEEHVGKKTQTSGWKMKNLLSNFVSVL